MSPSWSRYLFHMPVVRFCKLKQVLHLNGAFEAMEISMKVVMLKVQSGMKSFLTLTHGFSQLTILSLLFLFVAVSCQPLQPQQPNAAQSDAINARDADSIPAAIPPATTFANDPTPTPEGRPSTLIVQ